MSLNQLSKFGSIFRSNINRVSYWDQSIFHQTLLLQCQTNYKILSVKSETPILQLNYFLVVTLILQELTGITKHYQTHMYQHLSGINSLMWQKNSILSNQLQPLPGGQTSWILFFTSHPDLVTSCQTAPGINDHDSVIVEFSTQINLVKRSPREIFLYHKANWDLIRERTARISKRYFDLNSIDERSVEEN